MTSMPPALSVVVATRDRRASLERLLAALADQTVSRAAFEVIVVADGCVDDTVSAIGGHTTPFSLRVERLEGVGAAAARNAGAAVARGPLLVFLADDLEPSKPLLEAHLAAHGDEADRIVVGPYLPAPPSKTDYLVMAVRAWWHDRFSAMRRPAHRFGYRDCLDGNLSIRTELFRRLGGFDPGFADSHEDYEFGARALKAGIPIRFAPAAMARHYVHEEASLGTAFRRSRRAGRADVRLGHKHPELRASMPLIRFGDPRSRASRLAHHLTFSWPRLSDAAAAALESLLPLLEWLQLRSRWQRVFTAAERHWYLRGLADALPSRTEFSRFIHDGHHLAARHAAGPELEVDLADGIRSALDHVDRLRPRTLRIRFGEVPLARLADQPGSEPLRGIHVQATLAEDLNWPLFLALVERTAFDSVPLGASQDR